MEIDFDYHFGLNPARLACASLFRGNRFERGLRCLQNLELAKKRARDCMRETGPSASCVAQLVTLIESEHEGPHRPCICGRGHNAGDHQLLTIRAFGLDPVVTTSRTI